MSSLAALLKEQQQELQQQEVEFKKYQVSLGHSRTALPQLEPMQADDQTMLYRAISSDGDLLVKHLNAQGTQKLNDLKLNRDDFHRTLQGISRDHKYWEQMNFCLERLGTSLEHKVFLELFQSGVQRLASRALEELKINMAEERKMYHTECHAIEMALDCAGNTRVTSIQGTAIFRREIAARFLVLLMAIYHDYVQNQTPFQNERLSCQKFLDHFEEVFKPMMFGSGGANLPKGIVFTEQDYDQFSLGLNHLANAVIVDSTYLVNFSMSLKIVECQLQEILQNYIDWNAPTIKECESRYRNPSGTSRLCFEAQHMAFLLSHYDIFRYSNCDISARVTKDVRQKLDGYCLKETGGRVPLDRALLDMTFRNGMHVLVGQSLRMLWELSVAFHQVDDEDFTYLKLFHNTRELLASVVLNTDGASELHAILKKKFKLTKKVRGQLVVVTGELYNLVIHHLKNDLGFVANKNEMEAVECMNKLFPENCPNNPLGNIIVAGKPLMDAYNEWFINTETEEFSEVDEDGLNKTITIMNSPGMPERKVTEKANAAVVLVYLTAFQDGYNQTQTAVWQMVRDFAEKLKW